MPKEIICRDKFGNEVVIKPEELEWRISVCGILHSPDGKILFVQDESTQEWELPGGGIEPEESVEEALKREYREETSLEIEVGRISGFTQDFYYHRRDQKCYKALRICFIVTCRQTDGLSNTAHFINVLEEGVTIKGMSLELIKQLAS